jgi:hypothetical protein
LRIGDRLTLGDLPDEAFAAAFGTEWFIEPGVAGPPRTAWIF